LGVSGAALEGTYEEEDTCMTNVEEDAYLGGLGRGIRGHANRRLSGQLHALRLLRRHGRAACITYRAHNDEEEDTCLQGRHGRAACIV
jgi:hypothetical protein